MRNIGRYVPQKQIGSGSQGTVYLAEDPILKRNVAIKLLNKGLMGSQGDSLAFEQEAQALGRFQHQNIVSVYDLGHYEERPYIVFEFVEGELLSDYIEKGNLDMLHVIEMMEGITSGVAKAHQNGVVHRDLKPQNIIISEEGIPKIMDFGIAMLIEENQKSEHLVGTPRYMAPEYVRQKMVSPSIDVFALGAIFYEMLTGNAAFAGKSTSDVLARILVGPPKPPSTINDKADDVIDGICLKALAANPRDRYQNAGKLNEVLQTYLKDHAEVISVDSHGKATLEFLYRRMQRKKDFPALADSIRSINQLQSNSKEDAEKLAALIVNDFALTNKILKVVNSAYYGSFSGKISTVSRAIVVMGVDQIRSMAASLIFFEHMSDRSVAHKLKRLMASSLFRAVFAENMAASGKMPDVEEAFLCSMFYELGQALVAYYLPDEDREIERLIAKGEKTESQAAMHILGVKFEDVGAFVARQWNFPDIIAKGMEKLPPGKPQEPASPLDKYRLITQMSDKATKVLSEGGSVEDVKKVVSKYTGVLPVKTGAVEGVVETVRESFTRMSYKLAQDKSVDQHVLKLQGKADTDVQVTTTAGSFNIDSVLNEDIIAEDTQDLDVESVLSQGLQEATSILLETGDVSQVFNTVLETLYRGMRFRRVVLCLAKNGAYTARLGFGEQVKEMISSFRVTMDNQRNIFSVSLKKGVDVYIADVNLEKTRKDMPKWYYEKTDAGSFVLFPLVMKERPIGFIYGEYARSNQLKLETKVFNLIKSLRNQMILALRQR
jgi:serine/threonine protein kinase